MVSAEAGKEFRDTCDSISNFIDGKESLISRPQWGEITFESAQNDIETVLWIVEEARKLPIYTIPENNFVSGTQHLVRIRRIFEQIGSFDLSGDPRSLRDNIAGELKHEVHGVMSEMGIWLPLLAFRAGEIENWVSKMQNMSAEITTILQDTSGRAKDGLNDIESSVQAARAAAGEAGAAEFTYEFREEARVIEKRGKIWLWPTGIFATLALVLSVFLMFGLLGDTPQNTWEAIYRLGGRVIAISVLFYAAIWSGRIVLANMHLANVNKHRAVSLQTLQAFHQAADDPTAKDAVVLEAARAVYENVPSGYIARQAAESAGHGRTLEIIKSAGRGSREGGD